MVSDTPNQANYQDNQNFEIDINKIFTDWIGPIDDIRSYSNIDTNQKILDTLAKAGANADITGIIRLVKMETTVQESRCHAFFRWIGFPIVSNDGRFYNPGFDIIVNANKTIKMSDKISIATSPKDGFNDLSHKREKYIQTNLSIFSNPTTIDAGVLALSSGGTEKIRSFVVPLDQNSDGFDMNVDNQSYTVNLNGRVGENPITLNKYQDANGNFPSKLSNKRMHIIKPFIVDARIELTVAPQSRLVAVPFIPDNSYAKVSSTEDVKYPPLLERIIRERLDVSDSTTDSGTSINAVLDYIKTIPAIKDNALVNLVSNKDIYNQTDQSKFISSVNTIRTMMKELVAAQKIIKKVQGDYYWVPVPNANGPENGSSVQGIFLPTVIDTKLVTQKDAAILLSSIRNITNNNNIDASTANATSDTGNFGLKTSVVTFGPDTTQSLGDNNAQNSDTISQKRRHLMEKANNALKTVEIITGEFSGLGLCDIVAVVSALNIMTKENLVGFLDADAFQRMKNSLGLSDGDINKADFQPSMTEFVSRVKDFYNLMDKIYQDTLNNNNNS